MIRKTVMLFIFGATIASAQFMPRLEPYPYDIAAIPYLRSSGCPSAPAPAPVICQFMQPGLPKPQLIAPSTYIPPMIVEKCDKTELEIHLPAKKPIVIPQAPILPPITVPKFPVPVIVEKPILPPVSVVEPYETAVISGVSASAVSIPVAPSFPPLQTPVLPEIVEHHGGYLSEAVIDEIDYQAMVIPQPPAVLVSETPAAAPIPEYVQPLAPIPAAPELPIYPLHLPEIPVRVEIPPQPIVPPVIIEEPCITEDLALYQREPIIVRQTPIMPEPMPIVPMHPEPAILAEPCEPFIEPVMKMAEYPHFVNTPYIVPSPMSLGALPARRILVNKKVMPTRRLPYMRRI